MAFVYTLATSQSTFYTSSSHIWTCRAYSCPPPAVWTCTTTTTTEAATQAAVRTLPTVRLQEEVGLPKRAKLLGKSKARRKAEMSTAVQFKQRGHQQQQGYRNNKNANSIKDAGKARGCQQQLRIMSQKLTVINSYCEFEWLYIVIVLCLPFY
jgi:hypothetical protein